MSNESKDWLSENDKNISGKKNILLMKGFFISCDQYNRAKIMFIDDYNSDEPDNSIRNQINSFKGNNELSFTKSYISKKSEYTVGNNPMTDNDTCFNVKYNIRDFGYINDKPVPLSELKQNMVELFVKVSHYNFTKNNNKIQGWNLKLIKMNLLKH
jgi:hypothetical protein